MFDHVMLKVKDVNASKRFYTAALAPLGSSVQYDADGVVGFGPKDAPALWLEKGESNGPVHLAFTAKTRASVQKFYEAALPAGGKDNGKPGLRPQYHANYYGGFVKDPDGNNIEAVCHQEE
jgi:catechol 2,3-dioxygenase-like lactoylglutathione lyase family enzyme